MALEAWRILRELLLFKCMLESSQKLVLVLAKECQSSRIDELASENKGTQSRVGGVF